MLVLAAALVALSIALGFGAGRRALHPGEIGHYVTWMVVGATVFGFTRAAAMR